MKECSMNLCKKGLRFYLFEDGLYSFWTVFLSVPRFGELTSVFRVKKGKTAYSLARKIDSNYLTVMPATIVEIDGWIESYKNKYPVLIEREFKHV